jgi:hypothetical protein
MIDPEDQIAADIAAAEARGEDPFADKPAGASVNIDTPKDEPSVNIDTDAPANSPEEVADEPVSEQPATYKTDMPADYKEQRNGLVKEKAVLMKQLMDGEVDADEFAASESRISDALEDLTAQRIRAETLQEANVQTQATYQQREIQKLIRTTKAEVDYTTDAKAQRQFDMALGAVGQDPDNAGKDYAELLTEAHKVVMALRGVTPAPAKASAPRPNRQAPQPPQTLSGLPTAASSETKSVERTLGELSGDELERAFDALPKGELARLLKS